MKKIFCILILAGVCMGMFSFTTYAENMDELPGNSVYAPSSEQDAIYDIIKNSEKMMSILNNDGISVVKESITPVYSADFLEYAKTGVFEIRPQVVVDGRIENDIIQDKGNMYTAKTITEEGLFAGDLDFSVEDGIAVHKGFTLSPNHRYFKDTGETPSGGSPLVSQVSYADHARRIQELTNRDSFVPDTEVRYVSVSNLGTVFYINDGKTEALVAISAYYGVFDEETGDIVYIDDNLKKKADKRLEEYNEHMAEIEAWKVANPGKDYDIIGGTGESLYTNSNVAADDIINISEYLQIDNDMGTSDANDSVSSSTTQEASNDADGMKLGTVIGIISAAVVFVALAVILFIKIKKR